MSAVHTIRPECLAHCLTQNSLSNGQWIKNEMKKSGGRKGRKRMVLSAGGVG